MQRYKNIEYEASISLKKCCVLVHILNLYQFRHTIYGFYSTPQPV
jgi:hypothetical protein